MPIVPAVMTIAHCENNPALGEALQAAMHQAVYDALAAGVSIEDSAEILRRKDLAFHQVMGAFGAE